MPAPAAPFPNGPTRSARPSRALRPAPGAGGGWLLALLIGACILVEAVLSLADAGILGGPRLRLWAYENGAFWPGLLDDWRPNYPAQPWAMFVTYSFLHGGLVHLALNMVTLWSLGVAVLARVGSTRFCVIYVGSAIAGAGAFALLSLSATPMVGASGALFGLAGAILAWLWDDQPTIGRALKFAGRAVLILLLLNVALHYLLQGQLAWQAHLGGFLAGWILGIAVDPVLPAPPPGGQGGAA